MLGSILKRALPAPMVRELQYWQHRLRRSRAARNGAGAAFTAVYETKAWGDDGTGFHSGPGTVEERVARPYVDFLIAEFAKLPAPPRVLDLGCGDFKIGRRIAPHCAHYTGVDVVPALVERNAREFGGPRVAFLCADVSADPLPDADVVLVREAMQHMSNAQIGRLLERLHNWPVAYVTNIEMAKDRIASKNRDLVPGPDTRAVFGSGLFIDEPPFNFASELALSVPTEQPGELPMAINTRRSQRR